MNKLNIYKTIIKPIWTYGVPLWATAAMSHINKIETKIENRNRVSKNFKDNSQRSMVRQK